MKFLFLLAVVEAVVSDHSANIIALDKDETEQNLQAGKNGGRQHVLAAVESSGEISEIQMEQDGGAPPPTTATAVAPQTPAAVTETTANASPAAGNDPVPQQSAPTTDGAGCKAENATRGNWAATSVGVTLYDESNTVKRTCTSIGWDEERVCETCTPTAKPAVGPGGKIAGKAPCDTVGKDAYGRPIEGDCKGGIKRQTTNSDTIGFQIAGTGGTGGGGDGASPTVVHKGVCSYIPTNGCNGSRLQKRDGKDVPSQDCSTRRMLRAAESGKCQCNDVLHISMCTVGSQFSCFDECNYCRRTKGYDDTKPGAIVVVPRDNVQRRCGSDGKWGEEKCIGEPCNKRGDGAEAETKESNLILYLKMGGGALGLLLIVGGAVWFFRSRSTGAVRQ